MNEHELNNRASEGSTEDDGFTVMTKLVSGALERIKYLKQNPEAITGTPTCFPSLDRYTSGMQRGDLIVIAARPSMGKRIFASNIAQHIALVNKLPVAIMDMQWGGEALSVLIRLAPKPTRYSVS